MNFESFDEAKLLEFIEDQLEPAEARRLFERLSDDPESLARIEQLRADRQALRGLDPVRLPRSFLEELEPILARPMLIEHQPGSYRRLRHRGQRQRRFIATALAAAVVVIATAGLLVLLQGWRGRGPAPTQSPVAQVDRPGVDHPVDRGRPGVARSTHSDSPPAELAAASGPPDDEAPSLETPSAAVVSGHPRAPWSGPPVVLPFALVVSGEEQSIEGAIGAAVGSLPRSGSLVRNFSYEQARLIEQQWLLAHGKAAEQRTRGAQAGLEQTGRGGGPNVAGSALTEMARRVRDQIGAPPFAAGARIDPTIGHRLAGSGDVLPSFEQQLQLSRQGARYTIGLSLDAIDELLVQMDRSPDLVSALRLLRDEDRESPSADGLFLADLPRIREQVRALREQHADVPVMLPVVVESK